MKKKWIALIISLFLFMIQSVAVWAGQEMISLPGGYYTLQPEQIEMQLERSFQQISICFWPPQTILYFDGAPLKWNQVLNREELKRVYLFTAQERTMLGILPDTSKEKLENTKIRCINPCF